MEIIKTGEVGEGVPKESLGSSCGGTCEGISDGKVSDGMKAEGDKYEELRREISSLKGSLDVINQARMFSDELRTLATLIPGASLSVLDGDAFESIAQGQGLVMAYLMSERRRRLAEEANAKNALTSSGDASESGSEYFTLEEIRSMDRKTVRRNFDRIMKSLEHTA